jgi:hypothetical protein
MSTTQLFAELLVIGIGACVWVVLFVAAALGYRVDYDVARIEPSLIVVLVGVAYVLGIATDRLAYALFRKVEERIEKHVARSRDDLATTREESDPAGATQMENYVLTSSEVLGVKIQYNRSRLRICRAWVVNTLAAAVAVVVWDLRVGSLPLTMLLIVVGAILAMCLLLLWATLALLRDHHTNVIESYSFLKRKSRVSSEQ